MKILPNLFRRRKAIPVSPEKVRPKVARMEYGPLIPLPKAGHQHPDDRQAEPDIVIRFDELP